LHSVREVHRRSTHLRTWRFAFSTSVGQGAHSSSLPPQITYEPKLPAQACPALARSRSDFARKFLLRNGRRLRGSSREIRIITQNRRAACPDRSQRASRHSCGRLRHKLSPTALPPRPHPPPPHGGAPGFCVGSGLKIVNREMVICYRNKQPITISRHSIFNPHFQQTS